MCPKFRDCKFAHNAIELDLTSFNAKVKNLNGVVKTQNHKLMNDKAVEPWKPSAKNFKTSGK